MTDSTALSAFQSVCTRLCPGPFGERLPVIWSTMEQRRTSAGTPFCAHFILSSSISLKAADIKSALKEGCLLSSFNPDQPTKTT